MDAASRDLPEPIAEKDTAARGGSLRAVGALYRYVWATSGRAQLGLSALAIAVFLLELAPLDLQRRIVNAAVDRQAYALIGLLCLLYLAVALVQGGVKLVLNVYRGSVGEAASRRLRLEPELMAVARAQEDHGAEDKGIAISIIVSEVDSVGGFVGTSFSEPVLNGGILLSIFGYMVVMQPWMALVAVLIFIPQTIFIPVLQAAINRRTERRIRTVRALTVDIVDKTANEESDRETAYRRRVGDVYRLNMQIFRRKFGMTFLMNLINQLGIIAILAAGGWLLLQGRTDVGTLVAFISGLTRTSDPWGDLVTFFRDMTTAAVKFRLITEVLKRRPAAET